MLGDGCKVCSGAGTGSPIAGVVQVSILAWPSPLPCPLPPPVPRFKIGPRAMEIFTYDAPWPLWGGFLDLARHPFAVGTLPRRSGAGMGLSARLRGSGFAHRKSGLKNNPSTITIDSRVASLELQIGVRASLELRIGVMGYPYGYR